MIQAEIEKQLLAYLGNEPQAVSPALVAGEIGCSGDPEKFSETARKLEKEGLLIITKKGNLLSLKAGCLLRAKIISQSPRFSFARPCDGGEDIFISSSFLGAAMLGDLVLLKNVSESPKGLSGEVDRIVKPGSHEFAGTVVADAFRHRGLELKTDASFRYSLPIETSKRKGLRVKEGQKIFARVQPGKNGRLIAIPLKIYGNAFSAKICADAIIDENGITVPFSGETLNEAANIKQKGIPSDDLKGRLDLRDWDIFTIDGEDSKDLDDAISVEKTEIGWKLGVHIADVSHYVRQGTALDQDAYQRGTSVYFADRVIPMLPEDISNGICSLNANEDKLAFSAILTLDGKGRLQGYEFHKTVICSKIRGVYSEINRIFSGKADDSLLKKYRPVMPSLLHARELAQCLKQLSEQRGTVDLESRESRFFLDEEGVCVDIHPRVSGEAEGLIEQMMIVANEAAALYARSSGIPFVYRVHESPAPDRIHNLAELAGLLGFSVRKLTPEVRTADLAALMEKAKQTKYATIISHQMLRTMAKARYDSHPIGHFGLALSDYCHFTSPIRRYPDLAIHRILSELTNGASPSSLQKKYSQFVQDASRQSSECEVRAQTAERSAEDCYMAEYMSKHIGEIYDGIVSGVTEWGIYVELANSAEGFISASQLPKEYMYDGKISWSGSKGKKITIGDPLTIQVASTNIASGQVDFILILPNSR